MAARWAFGYETTWIPCGNGYVNFRKYIIIVHFHVHLRYIPNPKLSFTLAMVFSEMTFALSAPSLNISINSSEFLISSYLSLIGLNASTVTWNKSFLNSPYPQPSYFFSISFTGTVSYTHLTLPTNRE